mmetsp:Transcript_5286/g.13809  ORF Transcript_5286/g.13809 Transcript_5286/m.13809 type:complete len:91 (-) Transcript_5286:243-515(-)
MITNQNPPPQGGVVVAAAVSGMKGGTLATITPGDTGAITTTGTPAIETDIIAAEAAGTVTGVTEIAAAATADAGLAADPGESFEISLFPL